VLFLREKGEKITKVWRIEASNGIDIKRGQPAPEEGIEMSIEFTVFFPRARKSGRIRRGKTALGGV